MHIFDIYEFKENTLIEKGKSYKEICFFFCKDLCEEVLELAKKNKDDEDVFKLLNYQRRNYEEDREEVIRDLENFLENLECCDNFYYDDRLDFKGKKTRFEKLATLYNSLSWPLDPSYRDPYVYAARQARDLLSHREIFEVENYKTKLTVILILIWIRANFDLEELLRLSFGQSDILEREKYLLKTIYSKKGNPTIERILEKERLGYQKIVDIKSSILSEFENDKFNIKRRSKNSGIYPIYKKLKGSRKEIKPEMFSGILPCYIYDYELDQSNDEIDKLYAAVFLKLRKAYIKNRNKISMQRSELY